MSWKTVLEDIGVHDHNTTGKFTSSNILYRSNVFVFYMKWVMSIMTWSLIIFWSGTRTHLWFISSILDWLAGTSTRMGLMWRRFTLRSLVATSCLLVSIVAGEIIRVGEMIFNPSCTSWFTSSIKVICLGETFTKNLKTPVMSSRTFSGKDSTLNTQRKFSS